MKQFLNAPTAAVADMVAGLLATSPHLRALEGQHVLLDAQQDPSRVALISGGGSGHEPAHAGFVGPGMLTAAVLGEVFASPSVEAVTQAIRAVSTPPGVLLIVKNYTGDRLNFGLAAEQVRRGGPRRPAERPPPPWRGATRHFSKTCFKKHHKTIPWGQSLQAHTGADGYVRGITPG